MESDEVNIECTECENFMSTPDIGLSIIADSLSTISAYSFNSLISTASLSFAQEVSLQNIHVSNLWDLEMTASTKGLILSSENEIDSFTLYNITVTDIYGYCNDYTINTLRFSVCTAND